MLVGPAARATATAVRALLPPLSSSLSCRAALPLHHTASITMAAAAAAAAPTAAVPAAALAPAPKAGAAAGKGKKGAVEEEVDPRKYFENRTRMLAAWEAAGINPYPHKFDARIRVPEYVAAWGGADKIATGDIVRLPEAELCRIAGRIMSARSASGKLQFYDLVGEGAKVQIMFNASEYTAGETEYAWLRDNVRRGDIVGVVGYPAKTKMGELSIVPVKMQVLSPCMHMMPKTHFGLKDQETRYRTRYLDLMLNESTRGVFYKRAAIVNFIRKFLNDRHFLEVETPMMNMLPGGAAARPFVTYHNELSMDLFMRIAPELYLKQLVIGGLDRVYELGRQFRNEGIDLTHNPEFTTCEFYMAYADYDDLIKMTEDMVSQMVLEVCGSYKIKYHPEGEGEDKPVLEVDFTPPFKRISMIAGLEEATGEKFPEVLDSDAAAAFYDRLCVKHRIKCGTPRTAARLLDKLVGHFLEEKIINPTFITEHPVLMSPLAKAHRSKPGLTERFELFALTKELCNAYTELNIPTIQRERFSGQAKDKAAGDDEAQMTDESFCTALEYALPPTGGWGIGVDRLTMFLSDRHNIKEVLLFPAMRPDEADEKTMAVFAAAKQLATAARAEERKAHGGAGSIAPGVPTPAVAALPAPLRALDAKLALTGSNFIGGAKPTKDDADAYKEVHAAVAAGATLTIVPALRRWYELVSLFTPELRATWGHHAA